MAKRNDDDTLLLLGLAFLYLQSRQAPPPVATPPVATPPASTPADIPGGIVTVGNAIWGAISGFIPTGIG